MQDSCFHEAKPGKEMLRLPICPACSKTNTIVQLDHGELTRKILGDGNPNVTYGCCSCAISWNARDYINEQKTGIKPFTVKVIIAGSRTVTDKEYTFRQIDKIVTENNLKVGEVSSVP